MDKNQKRLKVQEAVESDHPGQIIMELLLDADEDVGDIAADFIENEVGRFDWRNNLNVIKSRGNLLQMVQHYLQTYGLAANPQAVVDRIEQMAIQTPGSWK